jgi:hypothetical protein
VLITSMLNYAQPGTRMGAQHGRMHGDYSYPEQPERLACEWPITVNIFLVW